MTFIHSVANFTLLGVDLRFFIFWGSQFTSIGPSVAFCVHHKATETDYLCLAGSYVRH